MDWLASWVAGQVVSLAHVGFDFALGFLTLQVLVTLFVGSIIGARFGWAGPIGIALAIIARAGRGSEPVHEHVEGRDAEVPFRKPKARKEKPPNMPPASLG